MGLSLRVKETLRHDRWKCVKAKQAMRDVGPDFSDGNGAF